MDGQPPLDTFADNSSRSRSAPPPGGAHGGCKSPKVEAFGGVDVGEVFKDDLEGWFAREARRDARDERYRRQLVVQRLTGNMRVKNCQRAPISKQSKLKEELDGEPGGIGTWEERWDLPVATVAVKNGCCYYKGLQNCGSVWVCPVCGAKIQERRALDELMPAMEAHLKNGGGLYFVTLTGPHEYGDRLVETLGMVSDAWSYTFTNGSGAKKMRAKYLRGYVRSFEITHGSHGFHPHAHGTLFTHRWLDQEEQSALWGHILSRWSRRWDTKSDFGTPLPEAQHFQTIAATEDDLERTARYCLGDESPALLRGAAHEVTRDDVKTAKKGHRSIWQIVDDIAAAWAVTDGGEYDPETGEVTDFEVYMEAEKSATRDIALWYEYEAATKGKRKVQPSRGLYRDLGVYERTDEDLAEEEVHGADVAHIPSLTLRRVRSMFLLSTLLRVLEDYGFDGGVNWLRKKFRWPKNFPVLILPEPSADVRPPPAAPPPN